MFVKAHNRCTELVKILYKAPFLFKSYVSLRGEARIHVLKGNVPAYQIFKKHFPSQTFAVELINERATQPILKRLTCLIFQILSILN